MSEHLQHLERSLRALLPIDFPDELPVYVVSSYDVSSEFRRPRNWYSARSMAWTGPRLDVWLEPFLSRTGAWRGRGFATIINEEQFTGSSAADIATQMLEIVLHEAAHWVDAAASGYVGETVDEVKTGDYADCRKVMLWAAVRELMRQHEGAPSPPWDQHDSDWMRAALHVRHRSIASGFDCGWLKTDEYLLADPLGYLLALEDELMCRVDELLVAVLAEAPPEQYRRFASNDEAEKRAWWKRVGAEVYEATASNQSPILT